MSAFARPTTNALFKHNGGTCQLRLVPSCLPNMLLQACRQASRRRRPCQLRPLAHSASDSQRLACFIGNPYPSLCNFEILPSVSEPCGGMPVYVTV